MDFHSSETNASGFDAALDHAADEFADSVVAGLGNGVAEALADPIVRALMAADRVDRAGVEALMVKMAATLANRDHAARRCCMG